MTLSDIEMILRRMAEDWDDCDDYAGYDLERAILALADRIAVHLVKQEIGGE